MSRLILEGSVYDGDDVKVRTLGEAQDSKEQHPGLGWVSNSAGGTDKNSVVVLRNHKVDPNTDAQQVWDDEEFLMEDGVHSHR